jgi:hypothetical protein
MLQQLLYAFGSLSDSDVFRWSEMLLDIVKDLHSGKRPSVREIAFRTGASQRRRAECFFEMSLKHIIGSGQVWAGIAEKLELNRHATTSRLEVKAQLVGQA